MSDNNTNSNTRSSDGVKHSDPIPIIQSRGRARSVSSTSSGSASSGFELPTPNSGSLGSIRTSIPSPSSPIFSYFMPTSPKTASSTFPLRRKFGRTAPVYEEDEEEEKEIPAALHMRRASTHIASKFTETKTTPLPEPRLERGTGFLRRLSLSSPTFAKGPDLSQNVKPPTTPPNSAVNPLPPTAPFNMTKPRRSATISSDNARPRRAPSPMGERILKGHFDGF